MKQPVDTYALAQKLTQELRRGSLVLATLSQLRSAKYGYSLMQELAERGLEVEQGTLYPLLRRLDEHLLMLCRRFRAPWGSWLRLSLGAVLVVALCRGLGLLGAAAASLVVVDVFRTAGRLFDEEMGKET